MTLFAEGVRARTTATSWSGRPACWRAREGHRRGRPTEAAAAMPAGDACASLRQPKCDAHRRFDEDMDPLFVGALPHARWRCRPRRAGEAMVHGSATFRERIALPPGAVFEATLQDVSRMDAPADTIAVFRKEDAGNPPYQFELAYDPATIIPSRRYAVRARVTLAGRLLFTTDQVHPVITQGSPTTVELLMKRVAGAAGRAGTGKPGELFATLPATFTGVLPCADCEGIEHHLDVMPDRSYALRTRYLGRDEERVVRRHRQLGAVVGRCHAGPQGRARGAAVPVDRGRGHAPQAGPDGPADRIRARLRPPASRRLHADRARASRCAERSGTWRTRRTSPSAPPADSCRSRWKAGTSTWSAPTRHCRRKAHRRSRSWRWSRAASRCGPRWRVRVRCPRWWWSVSCAWSRANRARHATRRRP